MKTFGPFGERRCYLCGTTDLFREHRMGTPDFCVDCAIGHLGRAPDDVYREAAVTARMVRS